MTMQPNRNGKGFTIVEVLIAAAILLVALLAVAGTLPTSSTNVDEGGRISKAVATAQQNLEMAKNSAFPPAAGACPGPVPTSFTCSLAVSLSGSTPNRLAIVTATVTWQNSQRSQNVVLETRIAE